MLTHRWPLRAAVSAAAVLLAPLLITCGDNPNPSPTPDPRIDQALEKLDRLTEMVSGLDNGNGPAPSVEPTPSPTITPAVTSPTPLPTRVVPRTIPTPNPNHSSWVQERLDALINLYDFTESGIALLRSLDLRQMRGEPGFFGSFGFYKWAGVGEAKPIGVMHEIGHSYWGGFPIQGITELSWETPEGEALSPAMKRYHADILSFMSQPPDHYEVLRQRLRNLPEVSNDNREPLLHSLEADMVYLTGGNLALVPPILRKYWSQFLKEGLFGSWYDAVAWYQSLENDDRAAANKYLGFEHLDLRRYATLTSVEDMPDLAASRLATLAQEEKQRLFDFADQFDLLLGEAQEEEKFQFWRGYLRDKVDLNHLHEGYSASLALPRAASLALALDFLSGLSELSPEEKARRLTDQLPLQPFLVNFLPALDNRTLLELFSIGAPLPEGATLQATASFVERLERFGGEVQEVLASARDEPGRGAELLKEVVSKIGLEQKEDLRLFFELLRDEDPDIANQVVQALDNATIRRLMEPVPAQLRFALNPEQLLAKLDVTTEAETSDLNRGIALLVIEPSGNYIIDEPYLEQMYAVVAERSHAPAGDLLAVVLGPSFLLEGFIQQNPQEAVAILDQDLNQIAAGVLASDPVRSPPARIIYRLVVADPLLAARLVSALEDGGNQKVVVDALAYMAYDKDRLERLPQLPISLEQDGRFLEALALSRGDHWLSIRLGEAFSRFAFRVAEDEVPSDFLAQFQATLAAAVATLPDADARNRLNGVIKGVAQAFPIES